MTALLVAQYVFRECLRRRVFIVVPVATIALFALYAFGTAKVFDEAAAFAGVAGPVEAEALTGATMLGLSMFATLFLGAVLATFLTFTVIRGDAEQGLLQPLVVRPLGRPVLLLGRFIGATVVSGVYVNFLFIGCVVITGLVGDWWPDRVVEPALQLTIAVTFIVATSLLGSVFLSTIANGIAVLMIFGAGLVAGFLGQIGEALGSSELVDVGRAASYALPFEALYQAGLSALTADTFGATRIVVRLGPFGGGVPGGVALYIWVALYFAAILGATVVAFSRRDI
jgi:Cu-processing system permease protein